MSDSLFTIQPSRLDWDPSDVKKVSEGGSLLGEGTFGSVYRGKYNHTTVAIKVIKYRGDVQSAGRTAAEAQHAREVRRLRALSFKHIVQCYGTSKSPVSDDVLIVTECLEGGSLYQALQQARAADARLSDLSFLTIASHVAKGLSYIHDSGFIHGDMKPHNVLMTGGIEIDADEGIAEFPPYVEAKIADFGMSKRLQGAQSADLLLSTVDFGNQAFGTYAYMAPEIFSGAMHLDNEELKRVDVYAFGVVLYEMLTGISPWQYEGVTNPMHLYNLVCGEQRRPAWGPRSDVIRPEYKDMIGMCWHHDNKRRPQIGSLIAQLNCWITEVKKTVKKPRVVGTPTGSLRDKPAMTSNTSEHTGSDEFERDSSDASDISRKVDSITLADANSSEWPTEREGTVKKKVEMFSAIADRPETKKSPGYWERSAQARPRPPVGIEPGESIDIPAVAVNPQKSPNTSSDNLPETRPLEFSHMAGVNVTRVVTQVIKQPEAPPLEILGAKPNAGLDANSLWEAVARQNGPQPASNPNPAESGKQSGVRPPMLKLDPNPMPPGVQEVPIQFDPNPRPPGSSSLPSGDAPSPGIQLVLPTDVPVSNPLKAAPPSKQIPNTSATGSGHEQTVVGGPVQPAPVVISQKTITVQVVTQVLQSPDANKQVMQWWKDGHTVAVAAALARDASRSGGPDRFTLISDLLLQTADAPESARNPAVAKDLCIAMGNISRGAAMERSRALRGIPVTQQILRSFSCIVSVYGAACYALANLLKISNDLPDDLARKEIVAWLSHAISFNLNGGPPPPRIATLAYTTASAARNYVWMNDANASTFLVRGDGGYVSAVELLLDSMLWFRLDPTVAEACLSAFAALAFYPRHRIGLVRVNFVSAAFKVMCPERPARDTNRTVLAMGLTTLGVLVSGPATPEESKLICAAMRDEGGVRCVVKVLGDAVRTRSFGVMEEGLYALAHIARFDRGLGEYVVHSGGVGPVVQAVWCAVTIPESVTVRCAEMMCGVAAVLSHFVAAASTMRQHNLAEPLSKLVTRFSHEPRVAAPGSQAIARVRLT